MQLVTSAGRRSALAITLIIATALAFFTLPMAGYGAEIGSGGLFNLITVVGVQPGEAGIIAAAILLLGPAVVEQFPFLAPFIDQLLLLPLPQMIQF